MSLSPQRQREGGRGEGCHEILGNFADNCGWLFGEGVVGCVWGQGEGFFYSFGGPRVQEVNLFFPTHANVFQHFFDFCYTGISRGVHQKLMWNFHGSWFLTLEFSRVSYNSAEFPRVKSCFLGNF